MTTITRLTAATALVAAPFALPLAASANDDRMPTADELSSIETVLTDAGYTVWEEIEFDDGLWEVDDARKGDAVEEYDLKLHPETFAIVSERVDR